jgi:hypothetical protein
MRIVGKNNNIGKLKNIFLSNILNVQILITYNHILMNS